MNTHILFDEQVVIEIVAENVCRSTIYYVQCNRPI